MENEKQWYWHEKYIIHKMMLTDCVYANAHNMKTKWNERTEWTKKTKRKKNRNYHRCIILSNRIESLCVFCIRCSRIFGDERLIGCFASLTAVVVMELFPHFCNNQFFSFISTFCHVWTRKKIAFLFHFSVYFWHGV